MKKPKAPTAYKDLRKPAAEAYQGKEQAFQTEVAQWLKKELYLRNEPQVFYHVANESKAMIFHRMALKAQGVLPGVSDVVLPLKSGEFSGIYCELKRAGGCPSNEQKAFLESVAREGYLAVVINDLQTFKDVFNYYLDARHPKNS